jgi:DNA-binding LacI/PurR family transcriptional regulator
MPSQRRKSPLTVGLLTRRLAREWPSQEIYAALLDEARRRNIRVVEVPNPQRARPTIKRNQIELSRVPWNSFDIGLLVEAEDTIRLHDSNLTGRKVLAVDQDATAYGLDSVAFDDLRAGALAARHLLGLGHLRFAVTEESNDPGFPCDPAWTSRRLGFESALAEAGGWLPPQHRLLVPRRGFNTSSERTVELVTGTAAAWAKLPANQRPTALFALTTHPLVLNKLVEELARHRIHVPRDLSIVVTSWSGQEILVNGRRYTQIVFDLPSLTRRVFDAVLEVAREDRRKNDVRPPRLFSAATAFVRRDSTAPPPF